MCRCVAVFYVFLWCVGMSASQKCSSLKSESLKFSVASRRNQTGHWFGQVILDHGAKEDAREWMVDVDHITTECDGDKSISVVASISAPPQLKDKQPEKLVHTYSSYQLVPGLGYYKLHVTTPVWQTAREVCATEGAHLLILNSDAEWAVVKKMWDKYPAISTTWENDFLHIGITDFIKEGQFVTLFGQAINSTGYSKWAAQEPNSGITANCGAVRRNGELYDSTCTNKLAFVCEIEL